MRRSSGAGSSERRSRAEWASAVAEWRASGLSTAEFCRCRGLVLSSFRWWRWRLSEDVEPAAGAAPVPALAALLPVRVVGAADDAVDPGAEVPAAVLELLHPSGVRLRVPPGFDERTLAGVLWALEAVDPC